MSYGNVLPLASIEAARPVFMIVMGIFLMIIAWRLAKYSSAWTARMIVAGAFLLSFGYSVLLPLYESGVIEPISRTGKYLGSEDVAIAWHLTKITVMNCGWLVFGLGVAMHARVFPEIVIRSRAKSPTIPARESVA